MAGSPGADEVGRVSIRVLPDTSGFRRELERDLRAIQQSLKVEIPVTVDSSAALAKLKALEKSLKRLGDVSVRTDVNGSGLNDIGDIDSKFDRVDTSTRNINRNSRGILRNFNRLSGVLTRGVISPIANFTKQLVTLNRIRAIILGITLAIPAVLGPIAGLLAGIPSLLLAFGAAGAAIALGFDGIKDAFSGLKDEVEGLKKAVSDTFRQTLTPQVKQLEKIFPVLERGLSFVAQGLSEMFGGFVEAITSAEGLKNLNILLARTGQLFADLQPFARDFTATILNIGRIGAENFDYLSGVMNRFARNFRDMIDSMDRNGALDRAFRGLSQVTDGLLTAILLLFDAGVQMVSAVGEPLRDALIAIGQVFVDLAPILSQISGLFLDIVTEALPLFTDLFRSIGPGIVSVFQSLANAIQIAAPGLRAMADGFSQFLKGIAPALTAIGQLITAIGPALGDALAALGPVISDVITALADALGSALPKLIPAMVNFASALGDLFVALAPIIEPLAEFAAIILDALAVALREVAPILRDFVRGLAEILAPVLPELAQSFKDLARELAPIVGPLLEGFLNLLKAIIPLLPDLIDLLTLLTYPLRIVAWAVSGLLTLLGGLFHTIGEVSDAVGGFIDTVGKYGVRFTEYMLNGFQEPMRYWRENGLDDLNRMEGGFKSTMGGIGGTLGLFAGDMKQAQIASSVSMAAMTNAGMLFEQQFTRFFFKAKEDVKLSISDILTALERGANGAGQAGTATGKRYADGLRAGDAAARVQAARLIQGVSQIFNRGAADAARKGAAIAQGFANGIANPAALAQAAASAARLMASISRLFPSSPAKEGPFSGSGWTLHRGRALVEGFAEGIRSQTSEAVKAGEFMMRGLERGIVSTSPVVTQAINDSSAGLVSVSSRGSSAFSRSSIGRIQDSGIEKAIERALSTWTIEMNDQGLARIVNRTNQRNTRR